MTELMEPVRQSLLKPKTILGAPREPAILLWAMVFLIGRTGWTAAFVAIALGLLIHGALVWIQAKHPLAFPILIRRVAAGDDRLIP